jgi:hypothetical protein
MSAGDLPVRRFREWGSAAEGSVILSPGDLPGRRICFFRLVRAPILGAFFYLSS